MKPKCGQGNEMAGSEHLCEAGLCELGPKRQLFFQQDSKSLAVDSGLQPGDDGECIGQSTCQIQLCKWSAKPKFTRRNAIGKSAKARVLLCVCICEYMHVKNSTNSGCHQPILMAFDLKKIEVLMYL